MPAEVMPGTGSMPRRARHLIPLQLPRRGEVIAACAVLLLLAHLLFAQMTLILATTLAGVSKVSRWHRWWLIAPVAAGLAWMVAVGPRAAVAGFAAGPHQVLAYLGGGHPLGHLLRSDGAFAGAGGWLPRQVPLALVIGSAEAALAGWLDWMHTDEWAVPPRRPGAFAAVRSAVNRRAIHTGALVTRDGVALGVAPATGARVELGWAEAAGGVLITGAAAEVVAITSFQLVHAALRRRKPVIVLDMTDDEAVARALVAVCDSTATPLRICDGTEGHYEPFRQAGPSRRLAMAVALLGTGNPSASADPPGAVRTYLRAVFELMEEVPADPRTPVLDDVTHLLNPLALEARFRLMPADSPRLGQLTELIQAAARTAQADPQALLSVARTLAGQRRPSAAEDGLDLARVVRERSAALVRADTAGLARLVCADLAAVARDLCRIGVDGDGLVWLHGWDTRFAGTIGGLVAGGRAAALPVLVSATSPAAANLATLMNAVLITQLRDGEAASVLAARTGTKMVPGDAPSGQPELVARPAVEAQDLMSLEPSRFVLTVSAPKYRLVHPGQFVPARLPQGAGQ